MPPPLSLPDVRNTIGFKIHYLGKQSINDSASIRQTALQNKIFCTTTMFGALAVIEALNSSEANWTYLSLKEINKN